MRSRSVSYTTAASWFLPSRTTRPFMTGLPHGASTVTAMNGPKSVVSTVCWALAGRRPATQASIGARIVTRNRGENLIGIVLRKPGAEGQNNCPPTRGLAVYGNRSGVATDAARSWRAIPPGKPTDFDKPCGATRAEGMGSDGAASPARARPGPSPEAQNRRGAEEKYSAAGTARQYAAPRCATLSDCHRLAWHLVAVLISGPPSRAFHRLTGLTVDKLTPPNTLALATKKLSIKLTHDGPGC
jgi:hypothetical protein